MNDDTNDLTLENAQKLQALLRDNQVAPELVFDLIRQNFGEEAVAAVRKTLEPKQLTLPEADNALPPLNESMPAALKGFAEKTRESVPDHDDIGFMHTVMCQLGLPRRKTNATRHTRICDSLAIQIDAGSLWDGQQFVDQPLPYGAFPRLILAYLNSEALRQRSPQINVGPSASAFLRTLGMTPNGGPRGSYTMFKKQVQALAACRLMIDYSVQDKAYKLKGDIIEGFQAWTTESPGCRSMWPESIVFSDRYYQSLTEHAVPVDMRALHVLKGSAFALDLYLMLTERLHRIGGSHTILRWHQLHAQFGTEYTGESGIRNFKREFLKVLKRVQAVYPKVDIGIDKTGIRLKHSLVRG